MIVPGGYLSYYDVCRRLCAITEADESIRRDPSSYLKRTQFKTKPKLGGF